MTHQVSKYGNRNHAVTDNDGVLVAVTVCKKGANEVAKRLNEAEYKIAQLEAVLKDKENTRENMDS